MVQRVFQLVRERNIAEKASKNQFHKTDCQEMSSEEVELLLSLTQGKHVTEINWQAVARYFKDRKSSNLRSKYAYLMPQIKKGPWSREEDLQVLVGYKVFGRNWTKIQNIPGVQRSAVQIRERVDTVLVSDYKRGQWTEREDPELLRLY